MQVLSLHCPLRSSSSSIVRRRGHRRFLRLPLTSNTQSFCPRPAGPTLEQYFYLLYRSWGTEHSYDLKSGFALNNINTWINSCFLFSSVSAFLTEKYWCCNRALRSVNLHFLWTGPLCNRRWKWELHVLSIYFMLIRMNWDALYIYLLRAIENIFHLLP